MLDTPVRVRLVSRLNAELPGTYDGTKYSFPPEPLVEFVRLGALHNAVVVGHRPRADWPFGLLVFVSREGLDRFAWLFTDDLWEVHAFALQILPEDALGHEETDPDLRAPPAMVWQTVAETIFGHIPALLPDAMQKETLPMTPFLRNLFSLQQAFGGKEPLPHATFRFFSGPHGPCLEVTYMDRSALFVSGDGISLTPPPWIRTSA